MGDAWTEEVLRACGGVVRGVSGCNYALRCDAMGCVSGKLSVKMGIANRGY